MLYEPTLFSLVDAEAPPPNAADGIRQAVADAALALDRGDRDRAAEAFIDYWMDEGTWQQMPEPRRQPIAASAVNVRRWAHALFTEPTPLQAFRTLGRAGALPGRRADDARRPGAWRASSLGALPRVEVLEFPELGHMGPVTHPERVNAAIARFLENA